MVPVSVAEVSVTAAAGVVVTSGRAGAACAAGAATAASDSARAAASLRANGGTSMIIGRNAPDLELAPIAGEVAVAGADEDRRVAAQVAHRDGALGHPRERARAGLAREPAGAADGGDAVAPAAAEAAVLVLRPQARRAAAGPRRGG